ncbi:thermostable hemolysin [Streptomyces actinomycinicus]|uniref:Thermostable hemolysin n=1 Tax=Streptomyces actinomycinicus TaxID=1695166 RepID=A0A937JMQ5_9ACTN|nr:thermostable hemolysin [Streptomyces actinomycinicus]MBL1084954.1 thermostable hemolysin [Streptomyces actinomycinicus]
MQIALARRSTRQWRTAAQLAHQVYATSYEADVAPDPDLFIVAGPSGEGGGDGEIVACAGLTFGTDRPLFSERYLDTDIESAIEAALGTPADRSRVVEVGALASARRTAGRELIRVTPIMSWCLGMEYILCTATRGLVTTLHRVGIAFVPIGPADPGRVPPEELGSWGTYYAHEPTVGVIPLNSLQRLFADSTGRYTVTELQFHIPEFEEAEHATR